jgi:hypothetical protein
MAVESEGSRFAAFTNQKNFWKMYSWVDKTCIGRYKKATQYHIIQKSWFVIL